MFRNIKTLTLFFILIILLTVCYNGCSDKSTNPDSEPPTIPPQSTMLMDMSGFSITGQAPSIPVSVEGNLDLMTKDNWNWAAGNVVFWGTYVSLINVTLTVPFAAFVVSFNQDPENLGDGRWLWEHTFMVFGVQHTSRLYGELDGNKVIWEMYISKDNGYTRFLWFKGESDLVAMEGLWEFYKDPENPTPYLKVSWHRTEDQKGDIKYTNIDPNSSEYSSYIFYDLLDTGNYDAAFDMYSASKNNHTNIEWHRINQNGRVRDNNHFGNDAWHCWNETWDDIECP